MNQKKRILKLITVPLFALAAAQLCACGDNAIEAEIQKQEAISIDVESALDTLTSRRENTDYYTCYNKARYYVQNYRERCNNFIDKYSRNSTDTVLSLATIIKMVRDSDNYNDKGGFIGENSDPAIDYLPYSKMLSITLTSYKQTVESINRSEDVGDPEIRFLVKSYIDTDPSEYDPISATLLDTVDIREWKGEKKVSVIIPRGIDAIDICPVLRDKNEHDAYYDDEDLLKTSDCVSVTSLGWVKENNAKSQTTKGEKATITWQWYIYSAE